MCRCIWLDWRQAPAAQPPQPHSPPCTPQADSMRWRRRSRREAAQFFPTNLWKSTRRAAKAYCGIQGQARHPINGRARSRFWTVSAAQPAIEKVQSFSPHFRVLKHKTVAKRPKTRAKTIGICNWQWLNKASDAEFFSEKYISSLLRIHNIYGSEVQNVGMLTPWLWILVVIGRGTHSTASKLRSWIGPDNFFEGILPSPRYAHGFTSLNGNLYVFGGSSIGKQFLLLYYKFSSFSDKHV